MQLLLESIILRGIHISVGCLPLKTLKMRGHRAKTVNRAKKRKINYTESAAVDLLLLAALEDSPLLAVYPHKNMMNRQYDIK